MTNIEKLLFDAKFSLKFMNGEYYLSGFNHRKSIRIKEENIYKLLDENYLCYMDEDEWSDFVEDYLEGK